jgi:hypothetical protein
MRPRVAWPVRVILVLLRRQLTRSRWVVHFLRISVERSVLRT